MSLLPWWQLTSIDKINKLIKPDWMVLEFGSGRSSIWLAQRAAYVISIECNPEWYKQVKSWSKKFNVEHKVDIRLWEEPIHKQQQKLDQLGFDNTKYDLIIIDGAKPRQPYAQAAYHLLKDGGVFLIDDSERPNYARMILDIQDHWCCINPKPDPKNKQPDGKWTRIFINKNNKQINKIHIGPLDNKSADLQLVDINEGLEWNRKYL